MNVHDRRREDVENGKKMASCELARLDLTWEELSSDVYFQAEFVALYAAPDGIDALELQNYRHASALRNIPGTALYDLETPHGYGGPIAPTLSDFSAGIDEWKARHREAGHVCEFLRFHPFFAVERLADQFDVFRPDRDTVVVDLTMSADERLKAYSQSTRRFLRKAQRAFQIRILRPDESETFQLCYEAGLRRNRAVARYYLSQEQHRRCLAAPWATTFVIEANGEAVGAAVFLHSGSLAHYHLGGLTDAGIENHGLYLLLDHAFGHFGASGQRWMHLGGGRSSDQNDPLLHFKRRFSERTIPFYAGGLIFDHAAFLQLGGGREGRLQSYRG
jgi:hypothetical protein